MSVSRNEGDDHDDKNRPTADIVLTKLLVGEITITDAATLLRRSERQVWRLRQAFQDAGPAALVHGNRGRQSAHRLPAATRQRILELAAGRCAGLNDNHLTDLLAEEEAMTVSRVAVRRILRAAGRSSPRRRRAPGHRSRRERMPQAGMLLQLDGSRHDWRRQTRVRRPCVRLLA